MKKSFLLALLLTLTAVAIIAVVGVRSHNARAARDAKDVHERPIPVSVVQAAVQDVPVVVEGLGTVVPLYTTTVKTQVDGQLVRVFYTEGQHVTKGDPIALVDPRPFEIQRQQAAAARAKDEATRHNAAITLDRDTALNREGLATLQQVDNDRAAVEVAAASVLADEAQMRAASLNITYAHIVSPIDGVTGIRLVDPGNIVHASDATGLVVITQLDPIAVIFTLPEDELPRVSAARAHGAPHITAMSRDGRTELGDGELTVVDNQINQQTATLKLKAELPNPESKLWPNQFVKARLLLDVKKGALVVPAAALARGPKGTFVYVIDATNHASARDVAADEIEGDRAIVTRGLSPGDRVVVDGQAQLKPGALVAVQAGRP